MTQNDPSHQWKTLDRDLNRLSRFEAASMYASRPLVGVGAALVFVTLAALVAAVLTGGEPQSLVVVVAAAFGAYMAINIGANDVANNMGPAVGAKALSMAGAGSRLRRVTSSFQAVRQLFERALEVVLPSD